MESVFYLINAAIVTMIDFVFFIFTVKMIKSNKQLNQSVDLSYFLIAYYYLQSIIFHEKNFFNRSVDGTHIFTFSQA